MSKAFSKPQSWYFKGLRWSAVHLVWSWFKKRDLDSLMNHSNISADLRCLSHPSRVFSKVSLEPKRVYTFWRRQSPKYSRNVWTFTVSFKSDSSKWQGLATKRSEFYRPLVQSLINRIKNDYFNAPWVAMNRNALFLWADLFTKLVVSSQYLHQQCRKSEITLNIYEIQIRHFESQNPLTSINTSKKTDLYNFGIIIAVTFVSYNDRCMLESIKSKYKVVSIQCGSLQCFFQMLGL